MSLPIPVNADSTGTTEAFIRLGRYAWWLAENRTHEDAVTVSVVEAFRDRARRDLEMAWAERRAKEVS